MYKAGVLSKDTEFTTNEFIESAGVPIVFGGSAYSLLVPAITKTTSFSY